MHDRESISRVNVLPSIAVHSPAGRNPAPWLTLMSSAYRGFSTYPCVPS
jgi:hypothetical protein